MSDKQAIPDLRNEVFQAVGMGIVEWSNALFFMCYAIHLLRNVNSEKVIDPQKVLLYLSEKREKTIIGEFLCLYKENVNRLKYRIQPDCYERMKGLIEKARISRVQLAHHGFTPHVLGIYEYVVAKENEQKGNVPLIEISELKNRAKRIRSLKNNVACFVIQVGENVGLVLTEK